MAEIEKPLTNEDVPGLLHPVLLWRWYYRYPFAAVVAATGVYFWLEAIGEPLRRSWALYAFAGAAILYALLIASEILRLLLALVAIACAVYVVKDFRLQDWLFTVVIAFLLMWNRMQQRDIQGLTKSISNLYVKIEELRAISHRHDW